MCLQAAEGAVMGLSVSPGELKTETVEEFISISDGQVRHTLAQVTGALCCAMVYVYVLAQRCVGQVVGTVWLLWVTGTVLLAEPHTDLATAWVSNLKDSGGCAQHTQDGWASKP